MIAAPVFTFAVGPVRKKRRDPMGILFLVFVGIMAVFIIGSALEGCAETMSANNRYRAMILLCTERATTILESKACRANVDFQFGVRDGGAP